MVLGVDIGGSHITAALVDGDKKALITKSIRRKMIDSQGDAATILDSWCEVIVDSYQGYEKMAKQIGIAMPGPFDYENGVCLIKEQDKFKSLYQLNLKQELANRLAVSPSTIHFINDAASFLQGEAFAGSASSNKTVLGFTLGTGLGSSICKAGIAIDAALWNTPFLESIAEDYLSTKWFVKRYFQLTGKKLDGVKDLAASVPADAHAQQVFNEFGSNLAQFLMPLIEEHKVDEVILGGNIAQTFTIFAPNLLGTLVQNQVFTPIKTTTLKEHAALIGAASCFINFKTIL